MVVVFAAAFAFSALAATETFSILSEETAGTFKILKNASTGKTSSGKLSLSADAETVAFSDNLIEPPKASVYTVLFNSITFYYSPEIVYKIGDSSWTRVYQTYPTSSEKATITSGENVYYYYFDSTTDPSYITFDGLSSGTTYNFSLKYNGDEDGDSVSFSKSTLVCLHKYESVTDPETHIITHKCSVCGYTYTEIEHIHEWTVVDAKDATCQEAGYIKEICLTCDEEKITVLDIVDHNWIMILNPSTCIEHGYRKIICSMCKEEDETYYLEYPLADHTPGEEDVVEATCMERGHRTVYCEVCGEKIVDEDIPITDHTPGEKEIVEATCTDRGHSAVYCTVCGEELSYEEIPARGHSWVTQTNASTCTEHGYTVEICSVCGEEKAGSRAELPLAEHKLEWVIVAVPTETTDGKRTQVCTVCKNEFDSETMEKLIKLAVIESDVKTVYELTEDNDAAPVGYVVGVFKGGEENAVVRILFSSGITVELDSDAASAFASANAVLGAYKVTKASAASGDIAKAGYDVENYDVYEIAAENADFNAKGKAYVTLDYTLEDGYVAKVYYVSESGRKTFINSSYADGKLTFTTNHFSTYVVEKVEYDASAGLKAAIIISCIMVISTVVVVGYLIHKTKISRKYGFKLS